MRFIFLPSRGFKIIALFGEKIFICNAEEGEGGVGKNDGTDKTYFSLFTFVFEGFLKQQAG